MQSVKLVWAAIMAAGVVSSSASAASAACQLQQIAEYKINMEGFEPMVDGAVNGQPVRFILDTGAYSTIISPNAAANLGLKVFNVQGLKTYGVGGGGDTGETTLQTLKIGNAVAHNAGILVTGRGLHSGRYAGLIGEDFLAQADLELDLANGSARLMRPKDCSGDQVAYWAKSYSVTPIVLSRNGEITVYVMLNGHRVLAELDTGASISVVTAAAAAGAGVTPQSAGVQLEGESGGLGANKVQTMVATFPTFSIGDETIKNAKLRIADLFAADTVTPLGTRLPQQAVEFPQMLLGADFIRAHRIYVARSQGKVYFSYNGGSIFPPPESFQGPIEAPRPPPAANTPTAR